jgi:hypothetical protein
MLTGLLQLELPGNSFVAELQQQQQDGVAAGAEVVVKAPVAAVHRSSSHNCTHDCAASCSSSSSNSTDFSHHTMHQIQQLTQEHEDTQQERCCSQQQSNEQPEQHLPEGHSEARQLSNWLTGLQQLQVLDLSECRLQQGLLDKLPELTALTRLQLRRACLDVPDPAAAGAAGAATQLQRLAVGEEDEEQQRIRYSQHVLALGADAAASCAVVGQMQHLVELDVSHIANACEQLRAGASAASGLQHLRSINISYTACTEQQLQQLLACCPNLRALN